MGRTARSRVLIIVFQVSFSLFLHFSLFSSFLFWDFILKQTFSMGQQTFVPAVQSHGGSSISIYFTRTPKDSYWCQWTIPYSTAKRITVSERTHCLTGQVWEKEGGRNHVTTCGISFFPSATEKKVQSQTPKTYGLKMITIN